MRNYHIVTKSEQMMADLIEAQDKTNGLLEQLITLLTPKPEPEPEPEPEFPSVQSEEVEEDATEGHD